jgi:hypothetical protein
VSLEHEALKVQHRLAEEALELATVALKNEQDAHAETARVADAAVCELLTLRRATRLLVGAAKAALALTDYLPKEDMLASRRRLTGIKHALAEALETELPADPT